MASNSLQLLDLPVDVLVLIFPYLDPKSFLALCATCKALQSPDILDDPAYWSHLTRTTFRVPNQPAVAHDGRRWRRLYRRMFTQSRVFTWGHNNTGGLGHVNDLSDPRQLGMRPGRRQMRYGGTQDAHYPREMDRTRDLGIVADVQCGGWATALLNDRGRLHVAGELDGERRVSLLRGLATDLRPLTFPNEREGEPVTENPRTAIRQFSAGRKHILGLADSGTVWCWSECSDNPLEVRFLHFDVVTDPVHGRPDTRRRGAVRKVVAGWDRSAALIAGIGIKSWNVPQQAGLTQNADVTLITDECTVPDTQYLRPRKGVNQRTPWPELADSVGEVLDLILLEGWIVFITDLKKIFIARPEGDPATVSRIVEIQVLSRSQDSEAPSAKHLQGSFRTLGVILDNGEVLVAKVDLLEVYWDSSAQVLAGRDPISPLPQPVRPASLQKRNVISLAFADYHYLALHSDGSITPHGVEPRTTGAMGLGPAIHLTGPALLRGLVQANPIWLSRSDSKLLPPAEDSGRAIWFDAPRQSWLEFMNNGATDPDESPARAAWTNIIPTPAASPATVTSAYRAIVMISDWVEAVGAHMLSWALADADQAGPPNRPSDGDDGDGLATHFALAISAAGWHSAALVLVNEAQERRAYARCVVDDPDYLLRHPRTATRDDWDGDANEGTASGVLGRAGRAVRAVSQALGLSEGGARETADGGGEESEEEEMRDTTRYPEPGKKWVWVDDSFPAFPVRDGRFTGEAGDVPLPAWLQ